jgi:fatty acid desaturase
MSAAPTDLSAGTLRRRFAEAFEPRPGIYWCDLLASAGVGWAAFYASGRTGSPASAAAALAVSILALYRAVLFIHELTHLRSGAVRGFAWVWNAVAGFPLMVPSVMYVGTHADHHKRSTYGTTLDPEYEPIAHWSPLRILASTAVMPLLPAALALRWAVIGPVSWLVPPLRPFVMRHLSTLVINVSYRRTPPRGRHVRRFRLEEGGAALFFWIGVAAVASGRVDPSWVTRWYGVGTGILVLNHLRTLAAHRYENEGGPVDVVTQFLDSTNVEGIPGLTALLAPVGLRYHALHHLVPSMPYHALGRVHRDLCAGLPVDALYGRTVVEGIGHALRTLLAGARRNGEVVADHAVERSFRPALSGARAAAAAGRGPEPRTGSAAGAAAR